MFSFFLFEKFFLLFFHAFLFYSFSRTYKQPPEVFCRKSCFFKISIKKRHQHRFFLWILRNFTEQQLQTPATAKSQLIKTQCIMFSLYRTLHEIESATESAINQHQWAKQFRLVNPIWKQCHIALILIIVNELLILVIRVCHY